MKAAKATTHAEANDRALRSLMHSHETAIEKIGERLAHLELAAERIESALDRIEARIGTATRPEMDNPQPGP